MTKNDLKSNIVYQTFYQVLNTCLPLITAPYLSRVLGAEKLGIFSYTSSIVAYFSLFAMLGTVNYGTRAIAQCKDNVEERSMVFCEVFTLQVISTMISLVVYFFYLFFICNENIVIARIQIITILSCLFDINWFFFGIEHFKFTVVRSTVIRLLTVVCILLLVKESDDLWKYTLIMLIGTLISQVVLWSKIVGYIQLRTPNLKGVINHLKPNLLLFVPIVAMTVYHVMDKTMLGLLSDYEQSGFYYNVDKVINIPLGVISGIGTVLFPRISTIIVKGDKEKANALFTLSLEGTACISIAMSFGIAAVSQEFIPVFFGSGFDKCILLTKVMSVVIIIKGISNAIRLEYLVPYKMEKVFTEAVILGAIANIIINAICIPIFGALGAIIGTILAELIGGIYQLHILSKENILNDFYKRFIVYVLIGFGMYAGVRSISLIFSNIWLNLLFEICAGGLFYIFICLVYWRISKNSLLTFIKFRRR